MTNWFDERLGDTKDIDALLSRAVGYFGIGNLQKHEIITLGFEDYNVKLETDTGNYVVKIFAVDNSELRAGRSEVVLGAVMRANIAHPHVSSGSSGIVYLDKETGLRAVCMDFVQGHTFYKTPPPTDDQLKKIIEQAVKINQLNVDLDHYRDEWSVTNIEGMYEKVRHVIPPENKKLVEYAIELYRQIPVDQLPVCFVHGDIIKSNVIVEESGAPFIVDFSCANKYPRIQELAVICANLMNGDELSVRERSQKVIAMYRECGGDLEETELEWLYNYTAGAIAMEYLGCIAEQNELGEDNEEIRYWRELGLSGLKAINGTNQ